MKLKVVTAVLAVTLMLIGLTPGVQAHDEVVAFGWGCEPYNDYSYQYVIVGWQPTYGYNIYGYFTIYFRPIYQYQPTWTYHHHWGGPNCGYSP